MMIMMIIMMIFMNIVMIFMIIMMILIEHLHHQKILFFVCVCIKCLILAKVHMKIMV